jgi:hypothetical protein
VQDLNAGHVGLKRAEVSDVDLRGDVGQQAGGGNFIGNASLKGQRGIDDCGVGGFAGGRNLNLVIAGRQGYPTGSGTELKTFESEATINVHVDGRGIWRSMNNLNAGVTLRAKSQRYGTAAGSRWGTLGGYALWGSHHESENEDGSDAGHQGTKW